MVTGMTPRLHQSDTMSTKLHGNDNDITPELDVNYAAMKVKAKRTIFISGGKLAEERRRKLMSQPDLAKASGVSLETIKHIEPVEGRSIFIGTAGRLAKALSIDPERFNAEFVIPNHATMKAAAHRKPRKAGSKPEK